MNQIRSAEVFKRGENIFFHGGRRRGGVLLLLAGTLSLSVLPCCAQAPDREGGAVPGTVPPSARAVHAASGTDVHWTYHGPAGPEHWAELSPAFSMCSGSGEQSPIDLSAATPVTGPALERVEGRGLLSVAQRARIMDILDNGHTIQVTSDLSTAIDLEGEHCELVQFHFHAPSEHTIDGAHAPLEAHFVHKSAGGKLAVVAVLMEVGAASPAMEAIVAALPSGPDETRHLEGLDVPLEGMPTSVGSYYLYRGSLTTPPCSEDVQWIVEAERKTLSEEQLAAMRSHLHDNNRPVQPLGGRHLQLVRAGAAGR